jgi:hypothetical protein
MSQMLTCDMTDNITGELDRRHWMNRHRAERIISSVDPLRDLATSCVL